MYKKARLQIQLTIGSVFLNFEVYAGRYMTMYVYCKWIIHDLNYQNGQPVII